MTAEMETDMVTLSEEQGEILPWEKETSSHDKLRREMLSCLLLRFPREAGFDLERRQSKMDGRQMGRSRSYGGNSQEWKEFKFVLKSYFEVTSTSDRSATESWQIPKNGLSSNCRKWCHNERVKKVNLVRSSTSSTSDAATSVDNKRKVMMKTQRRACLELSLGFIAIKQFSVDFVTSVHMCPRRCATHATLSLKVWGMREAVYNEMNLHGEVFTVRVFAVVCEGRRRQLLSMI